MHIPFTLQSEVVAVPLVSERLLASLLICTSESSVVYYVRESTSKCIYCTTEKPLTSPKWKDTARQILLHCTTNSRVQAVRLQVDFFLFLSQIAYLQNTEGLVLLFYGYFVYSQRHLYLKCN